MSAFVTAFYFILHLILYKKNDIIYLLSYTINRIWGFQMIFNITSTKNDKFKYFKNLKQKKFRTDEYTVEGKKSVLEALNSNRIVTALIISENFTTDFDIPENLPCYIIPDSLFDQLSSTDTPSGIICTIKIEKNSDFKPDLQKAYIYCDKISDPGNLGTIIRTADAAGFGGVLLSPGCVELYNPKTVRSSMGSFFHMDIIENITAKNIAEFKESGFQILSGVLNDKTVEYTDADMTKPSIIVIGNESNGVSDEIIELSNKCIKNPIVCDAESLNAAIAAAVIMYELLRQRNSH